MSWICSITPKYLKRVVISKTKWKDFIHVSTFYIIYMTLPYLNTIDEQTMLTALLPDHYNTWEIISWENSLASGYGVE